LALVHQGHHSFEYTSILAMVMPSLTASFLHILPPGEGWENMKALGVKNSGDTREKCPHYLKNPIFYIVFTLIQ